MAARTEIEGCLNQWLQPERFKDYGPNGLQVEGRPRSGASCRGHRQPGADRRRHRRPGRRHPGAPRPVLARAGWPPDRLAQDAGRAAAGHGINLLAYHLPLDAHAELGNNAQWAARLGWQADGRFGEQDLGFVGTQAQPPPGAAGGGPASRLGRAPTVLPGDGRPLRRLAWCSGGAQGYFEAAIAAGADAFLTGEISEPQAHLSRETGVAFLACGHHATERYGAPAVGSAWPPSSGWSTSSSICPIPHDVHPPRLLVTMGDPVGIGPEIIAKAFAAGALDDALVVGDVGALRAGRGPPACPCRWPGWMPRPTGALPAGLLPVWQPPGLPPALDQLPWGRSTPGPVLPRPPASPGRSGCCRRARLGAGDRAAAQGGAGRGRRGFPGHTEMLQSLCAVGACCRRCG
jgi:putative NIF3 family GTP cyclohydrolase 1 type 2